MFKKFFWKWKFSEVNKIFIMFPELSISAGKSYAFFILGSVVVGLFKVNPKITLINFDYLAIKKTPIFTRIQISCWPLQAPRAAVVN